MEFLANDFIDKHNKGNDFIANVSNRFYIYRLRNPENKNFHTYEIGYVENPKKNVQYNWDDVSARICEGFWGDKEMVARVVNLLNGC